MRTFAIVNRKGGVGKTTTAVNLAYVLATSCHLRVLLVDADGQANATQILLPRGEYAGLGALLRGMVLCYDELTVHTDVPGLDVLPAYRGQGLASEIMRQYKRREARRGRKRLILTCLGNKVGMYEKMGFQDHGISASGWGGEEWHEMSCVLDMSNS